MGSAPISAFAQLMRVTASWQGRYRTVRDNLRVKEVDLGIEGKRFIVCHNPSEAQRDRQERDAQLERIEAELARIEALREREARQRKNKRRGASAGRSGRQAKTERALARNQEKAHVKAECALRDHPGLGRYLRLTPTGRLRIDRRKVAAEERLDGKFLLSTSDPDISAEDVALGYKNLLAAGQVQQTTRLSPEQRDILARLGIEQPPTLTSLTPA